MIIGRVRWYGRGVRVSRSSSLAGSTTLCTMPGKSTTSSTSATSRESSFFYQHYRYTPVYPMLPTSLATTIIVVNRICSIKFIFNRPNYYGILETFSFCNLKCLHPKMSQEQNNMLLLEGDIKLLGLFSAATREPGPFARHRHNLLLLGLGSTRLTFALLFHKLVTTAITEYMATRFEDRELGGVCEPLAADRADG